MPTILQPIAADTPLAHLCNQWLAALAPVERLTSPKRPDSLARSALIDLTLRLHGLHGAVVKTITLLEQGAPSDKLRRLFANGSLRKVAIGLHIHNKLLLSVYAIQGRYLPDAAALSRLNALSLDTWRKICHQSTDFAPVRLQLIAVLKLGQEADWCFSNWKQNDEDGRKELLMLLRAMLGTKKFLV